MITCPKCEARVLADARRCPLCGTPLSLGAFRPADVPDPVLDPLLSLFERDEAVVHCPDCLNEFRHGGSRCRPCGLPTQRAPRSAHERTLLARPLADLGAEVSKGPPPGPPDLVRVKVARGLEEALACLEELRFVGIEPCPGSDSLDPFDDPETVGIYVRAPDREAARYIVTGLRPEDPLARPPKGPEDPRAARLGRARGYLTLGKYRDAIRILEALPDDGEASGILAEALLRSGAVRRAERHARNAAARAVFPDRQRALLLAQAALTAALGFDGTPFARGAHPEDALPLLADAVALAPRVLWIGKLRVEILAALGRRDPLREELRRLQRVNANLVGRDGWYRDLWMEA